LAGEIQDKTPEDVEKYLKIFNKKCKTLSRMKLCLSRTSHATDDPFFPLLFFLEYPRIKARIEEGEAKRKKHENLEMFLQKKITSVRYPMQELELSYPTTKGKVYSDEEDWYLLYRLYHYGMQADDVYERIKKDITEFPVFRFDWFFKSQSPQELQV
jgi:SWI/SNF-related matrix-associated actin-dependent regulator of chromatin subfamily A member 5